MKSEGAHALQGQKTTLYCAAMEEGTERVNIAFTVPLRPFYHLSKISISSSQ